MAFKIPVENRVSTYPGRITLKPVSGQTNVYDMERSDMPIVEGTPINKLLFDSKADALKENVTVYVSISGDDIGGDGSVDAPFATIQTAIDALPKNLNGFNALIDIEAGTYEERVSIVGFTGGKLTVGVAGRSTVIRGLNIYNSKIVELNISNVTWASGFSGTLVYCGYGSEVFQAAGMTVRCEGSTEVGLGVTFGSSYVATQGIITTVLNCARTAILATMGSRITLSTVTGSGNTAVGLLAERGALLSYESANLLSTSGNVSRIGGRILSGSDSSTDLVGASVE